MIDIAVPARDTFARPSARRRTRGDVKGYGFRAIALVVAAVLPVTVIASAMVVYVARQEHRAVEAETRAVAARVVDLLDREIGAHLRVLEALATSAELDRQDLGAFHEEARRALASQPGWLSVILLDLDGWQLLSARQPFDRPRVRVIEAESYREVLRTGRSVVGGISEPSPASGVRAVPIRVPVHRDGRLRYVLTAPARPEGIGLLLAEAGLPATWVGGVIDGTGRIVARSLAPERYVGQPANATALAAIRSGARSGRYDGRTLDGAEVVGIFATSSLTGWTVHLGIPRAVLEGPQRRAVLGASLGGLASVLLAAALAWLLQRDRTARRRTVETLESIGDAFYALDHDLRFTYANRRALELWRRRSGDVLGRPLLEVFPRAAGTETYRALSEAARRREPVHVETLSPMLDRWLAISIYPARGGGLSVYFRDISERKAAEDRQRLLLAELNHRVRNTLAVVQVIAARSLVDGRSLPEARTVLEQRLRTLAGAHTLLTASEWRGADLRSLAARELEPYGARVSLVGPPLALEPKAALNLALVLHELATNAAKHGALSTPQGRVAVTWKVVEEAGRRSLRLSWRETGGPEVAAPSSSERGFGRTLLELAVAYELGGASRLDFPPEGAAYTLDAPLATAQVA
jgi:two-component sensor histidine kinase/PAS domain-containing protein